MRVHDSQAYRKMDVTRVSVSRIGRSLFEGIVFAQFKLSDQLTSCLNFCQLEGSWRNLVIVEKELYS